MNLFLILISNLIFSTMLAATAQTGAIRIPDADAGVINGRVAVLFWPAVETKHSDESLVLLSAENCEAHLVPLRGDLNTELLYPCGQWFQPPQGRYKTWLEKDDSISSSPTILNYAGGPFRGKGLLGVLGVAPGGRLAVPPNEPVPKDTSLRLVHLSAHLAKGNRDRLFERRVSRAALSAGSILMLRATSWAVSLI